MEHGKSHVLRRFHTCIRNNCGIGDLCILHLSSLSTAAKSSGLIAPLDRIKAVWIVLGCVSYIIGWLGWLVIFIFFWY